MTFTPRKLVSAFTLTALMASGAPAAAHVELGTQENLHTTNQIAQTDSTMRDLWLRHAFWVRAVVVEAIHGNIEYAQEGQSGHGNAMSFALAKQSPARFQ
jgi:anti-sigma-K factor RskA